MNLDLNCDLGEGEPVARTRALLQKVTSANIACGGHAGDVETMERTVRAAVSLGVHAGAHPGLWSRGDFGRGDGGISPEELRLLLLCQAGALLRVAERVGAPLHHIKLHGALYHAVEGSARLARAYARAVGDYFPNTIIYARAGGRAAKEARRCGAPVWEEVFLDRNYRSDGALVPRGDPNALRVGAEAIDERLREIHAGAVTSVDGQVLRLRADTVCVHSDSPGALEALRAARKAGLGRRKAAVLEGREAGR